jgi:hypothetical protein
MLIPGHSQPCNVAAMRPQLIFYNRQVTPHLQSQPPKGWGLQSASMMANESCNHVGAKKVSIQQCGTRIYMDIVRGKGYTNRPACCTNSQCGLRSSGDLLEKVFYYVRSRHVSCAANGSCSGGWGTYRSRRDCFPKSASTQRGNSSTTSLGQPFLKACLVELVIAWCGCSWRGDIRLKTDGTIIRFRNRGRGCGIHVDQQLFLLLVFLCSDVRVVKVVIRVL